VSRLEKLQKLAAADPGDPFVHYGLGLEYAQLERWEEARAAFAHVLELDPHYVAAHLQKARAELRLGRRDIARQSLQTGIAVATSRGDKHAADEMSKLLETLGAEAAG
jgi:tetratricopeptide (TPR) repeat protein